MRAPVCVYVCVCTCPCLRVCACVPRCVARALSAGPGPTALCFVLPSPRRWVTLPVISRLGLLLGRKGLILSAAAASGSPVPMLTCQPPGPQHVAVFGETTLKRVIDNGHLSREDTQVADGRVQRCSTSLILGDTQIRTTTMRWRLAPVRVALVNKSVRARTWREGSPRAPPAGLQIGAAATGNSLEVAQKIKTRTNT